MKKNNNGIYILMSTIIFCLFGYYAINKLDYNNENLNRVETSVSVSDDGISYGVDNVYDAVVTVKTFKDDLFKGLGSGFIYDESGHIITNYHVIENIDYVQIILSNGKTIKGEIIGSDEYYDVAVIKIDEEEVIKIARIGDSKSIKMGDTVFAVGSPLQMEYSGTVTRGIISAKNRMLEVSVSSDTTDWIMNLIQTDAAINPGNSGGPLCNTNGDVIGVNTLKVVTNDTEGIGLAIPIEDAYEAANRIVKGEEIKRPFLGISMSNVDETSKKYLKKQGINLDSSILTGVAIVSIESGKPASNAGIMKSDVIIKIGDYDIKNIAELRYYLYKYNINDEVLVKIIRGTEEIEVKVVLTESVE